MIKAFIDQREELRRPKSELTITETNHN